MWRGRKEIKSRGRGKNGEKKRDEKEEQSKVLKKKKKKKKKRKIQSLLYKKVLG